MLVANFASMVIIIIPRGATLRYVFIYRRKNKMRMIICKFLTTLVLIFLLPIVMCIALISIIANVLLEFLSTVGDLWATTEE